MEEASLDARAALWIFCQMIYIDHLPRNITWQTAHR